MRNENARDESIFARKIRIYLHSLDSFSGSFICSFHRSFHTQYRERTLHRIVDFSVWEIFHFKLNGMFYVSLIENKHKLSIRN